jgi:arginyl-tRNA synthetase
MTGNEQSEYFKVMLAALLEINPDLAAKTRHLPFGMVRLTTGKMSSRTGDVITADWLIGEAQKRIYTILDSNKTNYSTKEKDDIAQKAAVAAIKYSMLRVNAISDIAFDIEASVSFEGDSGPYLQYTYARAKSVLRKSDKGQGTVDKNSKVALNPEERILARQLMQFPDVVAEAATNFAPNTICTYLFHLAQEFNLFYAKHPIIGNDLRLTLTAATAQVIKNGLYLLGIETMEKM